MQVQNNPLPAIHDDHIVQPHRIPPHVNSCLLRAPQSTGLLFPPQSSPSADSFRLFVALVQHLAGGRDLEALSPIPPPPPAPPRGPGWSTVGVGSTGPRPAGASYWGGGTGIVRGAYTPEGAHKKLGCGDGFGIGRIVHRSFCTHESDRFL